MHEVRDGRVLLGGHDCMWLKREKVDFFFFVRYVGAMSTAEYRRQKFSVPPPVPDSFGRCRHTPISPEKFSNKNGLRSVGISSASPSR